MKGADPENQATVVALALVEAGFDARQGYDHMRHKVVVRHATSKQLGLLRKVASAHSRGFLTTIEHVLTYYVVTLEKR